MADATPTINIAISKQNNSGYNVNLTFNPDGKSNKYETCCFTTAKEVGDYIASFLSQVPTPKSDLFEFSNPDKILVPKIPTGD